MRAQTVAACWHTAHAVCLTPLRACQLAARVDTGAHRSDLPHPRGARVAAGTRAVCSARGA
jgi:hypothetical protein